MHAGKMDYPLLGGLSRCVSIEREVHTGSRTGVEYTRKAIARRYFLAMNPTTARTFDNQLPQTQAVLRDLEQLPIIVGAVIPQAACEAMLAQVAAWRGLNKADLSGINAV